jgi:hypothetical protein
MAYDLLTKKTSPRNFGMGADPLVWTPGAVKAELLRVLGLLDTANVEASQASQARLVTPDEWRLWRQAYLTMHGFLSKASDKWGSNALQAQAYEREVAKWRTFFVERGGKTVGPKGLGRRDDSPLLTPATALLFIGGLASAGYLIASIKK